MDKWANEVQHKALTSFYCLCGYFQTLLDVDHNVQGIDELLLLTYCFDLI